MSDRKFWETGKPRKPPEGLTEMEQVRHGFTKGAETEATPPGPAQGAGGPSGPSWTLEGEAGDYVWRSMTDDRRMPFTPSNTELAMLENFGGKTLGGLAVKGNIGAIGRELGRAGRSVGALIKGNATEQQDIEDVREQEQALTRLQGRYSLAPEHLQALQASIDRIRTWHTDAARTLKDRSTAR